jgi:hypothetical protein
MDMGGAMAGGGAGLGILYSQWKLMELWQELYKNTGMNVGAKPSAAPSEAPSASPSSAPSEGELDGLRENGEPYPDHSESNGRHLPGSSNPNSSMDKVDPNGKVVQRRYYGPDGSAIEDIDYSHPNGDGTHEFPHRHKWIDGVRGSGV